MKIQSMILTTTTGPDRCNWLCWLLTCTTTSGETEGHDKARNPQV